MNSWEVTCLVTGIIWIIAWLFLFFYRAAIQAQLRKEAKFVAQSIKNFFDDLD